MDGDNKIRKIIKRTLNENTNIFSNLKSELALSAQKVYDRWEQNEEGYCDSWGYGGICGDIADAMCDVLFKYDIECTTVSSSHEVHVYVVAKTDDGIYYIDIPYREYETGGGYCWKKIPNVEFDENCVVVDRISSDPDEFENYIGD